MALTPQDLIELMAVLSPYEQPVWDHLGPYHTLTLGFRSFHGLTVDDIMAQVQDELRTWIPEQITGLLREQEDLTQRISALRAVKTLFDKRTKTEASNG